MGDSVSLTYIDRSGVLSSGLINIHEDPESLLRIVVGPLFVSPIYLGYDATIITNGKYGLTKVQGIEHSVLKTAYTENSIFGKGTVVYKVRREDKNVPCALKDTWVGVTRKRGEAEILHKLHVLGITNIPEVVVHEVVHVDGRKDSTAHIRDAVRRLRSTNGTPHNVEEGRSKDEKEMDHYVRDHHRLVTEPFGEHFSEFRCLEEFLLAVKDVISGEFSTPVSLVSFDPSFDFP